MDDLIYRQEAIEALFDWEMTYDWDDHCREEDPKPAYIVSPSDVIEHLPSAEPKWIPVMEDTPDEEREGWYLVTDDSGGVRWLEVEHYDPESGLKPFCTVQNPVAWMRCPNPYKAGE